MDFISEFNFEILYYGPYAIISENIEWFYRQGEAFSNIVM